MELVELLKTGGIAVIPTDTIYGIVASALNEASVEKIYSLRKRQPDKPMITLISSLSDLELFGVEVTEDQRELLEKLWPNKLSVILPCNNPKFAYLHRGTNSLAFRMPAKQDLLELLSKTGPLVAPSANTEGSPEAKTIDEAKAYFGDEVAVYLDQGALEAKSSTLINLSQGKIQVLRQGEFVLPKELNFGLIEQSV